MTSYSKFSEVVRNRGDFIEYVDKGTYRIKKSFIYWIDYETKNEYIIVPQGFTFDFNSSPCFCHCLIDTDEFISAIVHDYLYSRHSKVFIIDNTSFSRLALMLMSSEQRDQAKQGLGIRANVEVCSKEDLIEEESEYLKDSDIYYKRYMTATRKFADEIWYYGAIEESEQIFGKKKRIKIFFGYLGIRLFGWLNFR